MSGHTPGPWEIVNGDEWTTDIATSDGEYEDGRKRHWNVASVNRRRDEWEANRRLVAAAPELLEACQTFAEWLRREDDGFPSETRFNTPEGEAKWREWYAENLRVCALAQEQARAAIAKATGEGA